MEPVRYCEKCHFIRVYGRRRYCLECKKHVAVAKARKRYLRLKGTPDFRAYQRDAARKYRAEKRDAINARRREIRRENADAINARRRAWYAMNAARLNANRRTPEARAAWSQRLRAWRTANPDYTRRYRMKRKVRELNL